ncbi:MAG: peptidoglycan-binding protein, partial [Parcubacteria group bacterium]|nr:peptidoglycan-binding protein [Parcubacteria group bacterium]
MRRLLFIMATILFIAPIFVLGQSALPKSVSGLQNIIQQLQEQIKLLQRQIGELKGQVETSKKDIEVSRQEIENIKFTRELRRGMKGDDVKEAQTFLAEQFPEFLSKKAVTGYFGVLTETAVKKFQKKYGLKTVGRVDANMIKKMNELLAEELNNNEEITPDVAQEIQKETSKQITQILPLTIIEVTSSPTILPISSPVETVPLVVSPLPIVLLPPVIAPPQTSGSASVNPSSNATTTTAPAIVAGSLQATISTLALTRDPIVRGASNVSVASFSIANSTAKNISLSSLYLVCQGCSQYASTDFTAVRLYSSSTGVQIGTTVNPIPGTSQFFNFSFKEGDFVVPASSALSFLVKIDTTPPSTLFQFPLSFYIEWRSASVYSGESINGLPLYATPSWSLIRPTSNATTTSTGTTGTATPSTSAATTTTIPESFAPPEPLNNEAGVWAQVDIATGQILSTAICTRSVCGINGEYHGYVPPSSWATGSIWWPTSKRYIWQMSGQAGYSSGTFNFSTYVFSVTGGTIFNGIFTAGSGTSSATTSSSYATTTPSTTTVVNYPGFFMTTDKQNYSPGDTISLTIRRADSGTSNVSVEFSIVAPNKTAAERTQKNYSLDVTQETTVQVSTDQEPFKSSFDGTYLLLLCAVGKNCGDGKTNSTSINYT